MEYFLSIAGERSGPFSQFQIIERIREGSLKGPELVWHKGTTEWQPLKELHEFGGYWPVTEEQITQAEEARRLARLALDTPQPWLRFWARMVDYLWFFTIVWFLLGISLPQDWMSWLERMGLMGAPIGAVIFLLFIPMEAWWLSRRGATPGKALLRIQVRRQDGGLPTYQQALARSALVYVRGVGLWLPLVSILVMLLARIQLRHRGITSWDQNTQLRVEHGEPELWRYLTVVAIIAFLMIGTVIGLMLNPQVIEAMKSLPK